MPTRQLPADPSLSQLKEQAKDLLRAQRERSAQAFQRIREFHPRFREASDDAIERAQLKLGDAQLVIAREYGFASWPKLKAYIERPEREDFAVPAHERITDKAFRHAVDLMDAGDAEGLRDFLRAHPAIVRQRMNFEGGNYFRTPALLEFVAENPTRRGTLPANIAEVARVILDAGAKEDRSAMNSALGLSSSSAVANERGVQIALIDALCDYGADPDTAMPEALLYGQFDSVDALVRRGATLGLVGAAARGLRAEAEAALPESEADTRQRALAIAAQFGHEEIVRLLLDAGVDPSRFAPPGGHSHATPLHQAAIGGHEAVVRLLVERGARTDVRDILFGGTPLGWAEYGGHPVVAEYLRKRTASAARPRIFLRTEHLVFRTHEPGDEEAFVRMHTDANVRRFVGGAAWSEEKARQRFRTQYVGKPTEAFGLWALEHKASGSYAGACGVSGGAETARLAYYLAPEFWGSGLASEAAAAIVAVGFDQLKLARITATSERGHAASQRILANLGFLETGEEIVAEGRRVIVHYELTRAARRA